MKSTKDIIKRILLEQAPPEGEEFSPPDGPPYNDYYDVGLALRRIVINKDNGEWSDTNLDGILSPGETRYFDVYPLFYDSETVSGRNKLANHLAILTTHASSENGKNKLTCNIDRCD